jgi:broad specificity phosphatase PhoE
MEAKNIYCGKIILIRHGQSKWNEIGMCQGQLNSNLTDRGKGQAVTFGWTVEEIIDGEDIRSVRIICSPQDRTMQTAKIVMENGGRLLGGQKLRSDARLMEGNMGIAQGKIIAEWDTLMPEDAPHRKADKWLNSFPGGESYLDIHRRTVDFLNDNPGGTMVVVTHEMISKCIRGVFSKMPQGEMIKLKHNQDTVYLIDREKMTVEEISVNP